MLDSLKIEDLDMETTGSATPQGQDRDRQDRMQWVTWNHGMHQVQFENSQTLQFAMNVKMV
jgi:hypothetical protein